jgi:hypothetical protein
MLIDPSATPQLSQLIPEPLRLAWCVNFREILFADCFSGACPSGLTISVPQFVSVVAPYSFTKIRTSISGTLHANNTFAVIVVEYSQVNVVQPLKGNARATRLHLPCSAVHH